MTRQSATKAVVFQVTISLSVRRSIPMLSTMVFHAVKENMNQDLMNFFAQLGAAQEKELIWKQMWVKRIKFVILLALMFGVRLRYLNATGRNHPLTYVIRTIALQRVIKKGGESLLDPKFQHRVTVTKVGTKIAETLPDAPKEWNFPKNAIFAKNS